MSDSKQLYFGDFVFISYLDKRENDQVLKLFQSVKKEINITDVNIRESVFQIFPKSCKKLNDYYTNDLIEKEIVTSINEFEDASLEILSKFLGKEVKYNDEIRLFNPFSQAFLSIQIMNTIKKKKIQR